MRILVTGVAGFIGYHLSLSLLRSGHTVIGLDNLNSYYDVNLKIARLTELGISIKEIDDNHTFIQSNSFKNFEFIKCSLEDKLNIDKVFQKYNYDIVCNLAAQAGVRYSLEHPDKYINSNILGFFNILEGCKSTKVPHLIYASSSSVYGNSTTTPFKTSDFTDSPVSLYAATKKSNELMAHTYSHLYDFKTTGLRFFTVYGPWGRPDMAYFKFTEAILKNESIPVFNNGQLERDFTYIDDIIGGINKIVEKGFISNSENSNNAIYNIGNGKPVKLMDFIAILEKELKKKATFNMLPMQDGDVYKTWTDIEELKENYNYRPAIDIEFGIHQFVKWYTSFYKS
ncbi:NAD-dependent epimerase/dehydratase family protein [Maribacter dokdonensis]|uniref:NAD-dependent epimerase/dehydratase family protein n=1 Tax=Maribacter dokdonensis TaxID=320912 RepID=UPI001C08875A|nr:NAD-dependent epimerase/dehydratase family protein [Maribacter dokdonensis]MBU2901537.1 GDP-mannose 4,6-dehydratase [Maribacter dokdonensis]